MAVPLQTTVGSITWERKNGRRTNGNARHSTSQVHQHATAPLLAIATDGDHSIKVLCFAKLVHACCAAALRAKLGDSGVDMALKMAEKERAEHKHVSAPHPPRASSELIRHKSTGQTARCDFRLYPPQHSRCRFRLDPRDPESSMKRFQEMIKTGDKFKADGSLGGGGGGSSSSSGRSSGGGGGSTSAKAKRAEANMRAQMSSLDEKHKFLAEQRESWPCADIAFAVFKARTMRTRGLEVRRCSP